MKYGSIMLWYGQIANIPDGWHLCDGDAGTPDLRDKFVVGAGDSYNPDATGGAASHTHTFISDEHAHTLPAIAGIAIAAAEWRLMFNLTEDAPAIGTTDSESSLPPYYALAYIMKIS